MKFFSTGHDRKKISAHATIYFPDHGHCLLLGVLLPFPGVHGGVGPAVVGVLPEVVEVDAVVRREVADVAISENQANDFFKNASIFLTSF